MWIMTTVGFFSIVRKPGETDLTVRARTRDDLAALRTEYLPSIGPIAAGEGTDYPYRARVAAEDLAAAIGRMVEDIDYSNFKDTVAARQGRERALVYGDVWSALRKLTPVARRRSEKPPAYGGVVVDAEGRILLYEPRGHFSGMAWTFPKGHAKKDEGPEDAASRETLEETGVFAEIMDRIPGIYAGTTTQTVYFHMSPTGRRRSPDPEETDSVMWATPEEAEKMIHETTNPVSRERDLRVLAALREHLRTAHEN